MCFPPMVRGMVGWGWFLMIPKLTAEEILLGEEARTGCSTGKSCMQFLKRDVGMITDGGGGLWPKVGLEM